MNSKITKGILSSMFKDLWAFLRAVFSLSGTCFLSHSDLRGLTTRLWSLSVQATSHPITVKVVLTIPEYSLLAAPSSPLTTALKTLTVSHS